MPPIRREELLLAEILAFPHATRADLAALLQWRAVQTEEPHIARLAALLSPASAFERTRREYARKMFADHRGFPRVVLTIALIVVGAFASDLAMREFISTYPQLIAWVAAVFLIAGAFYGTKRFFEDLTIECAPGLSDASIKRLCVACGACELVLIAALGLGAWLMRSPGILIITQSVMGWRLFVVGLLLAYIVFGLIFRSVTDTDDEWFEDVDDGAPVMAR